MRSLFVHVSLVFCLLSTSLSAAERITRFHSDIEVRADRSLLVTESISVIAEQRDIRRGIYRDLPNSYLHPRWGKFGIKEKTHYKIESILLDGGASDWHQVALPNGIRIYIGDKTRLLAPGNHTYKIRYSSTEQISQFEGNDILNWNVNGQDWVFPSDKVSATVRLPNAQRSLIYNAFTGKSGSTESAVKLDNNHDGSLTFTATRPFSAYEGMTISLQLPQNTVAAPNADLGQLGRLMRDNWKWFSGLGLLFLLPLYYLQAWRRFGVDPDKGAVVADYHPVRGLSPAAHRYIELNKADNPAFSAALLNMAVKGYLRIEQISKTSYTLHKLRTNNTSTKRQKLSAGEAIVFAELFKTSDQISLGKKFLPHVAKAKQKLGRMLKQEWRDAIYQNNHIYSWMGLAIGLLALAFCGLHLANAQIKIGHLLPMLIFVLAGLAFTQRTSKSTLFAISGFLIYAGLQNGAFSLFNSQVMIWLSLFVVGLFALFYYLLKAPTPFGQKMLDELAGFRLYLAAAEQNRLDILHPPEKTPELFEKLLPYAIALGVENQWGKQFTAVFKSREGGSDEYQPNWYVGGHHSSFSNASWGTALSAGLASSVAAATVAPSTTSSGGFSGGAGGGGGGGGGGGW